MMQSGWVAGLVVGLAIGLSGLTGVAVGAWWATPPEPPTPRLVFPTKKLPAPPPSPAVCTETVIDVQHTS
jgi:hypothetical protein